MNFPLIQAASRNLKDDTYWVITCGILRDILIDRGYKKEDLLKIPKKRLWFMVTGRRNKYRINKEKDLKEDIDSLF